jgi:hypothetical protein
MMAVMIMGLTIFFFSFLMSFSKKNVKDENGAPTSMQSRRFFYLK